MAEIEQLFAGSRPAADIDGPGDAEREFCECFARCREPLADRSIEVAQNGFLGEDRRENALVAGFALHQESGNAIFGTLIVGEPLLELLQLAPFGCDPLR